MKLSQIAAMPAITINASDTCQQALQMMREHRFRHLPVMENDKPVGLVSERELYFQLVWLASEGSLETMHPFVASSASLVREVMSTPLLFVSPDTPVVEAADLMLREQISALPLVKDDQLVGIVTETDLVRCFAEDASGRIHPAWRRTPVSEAMTSSLATVEPETPTREALRVMGEQQIRHLAVLDENQRLAGIVSDRDIFRGGRKATEQAPPERPEIVRDVMSVPPEMIDTHTRLAEAAGRMAAERIGALPVMDAANLAGLISETDILRVLAGACED